MLEFKRNVRTLFLRKTLRGHTDFPSGKHVQYCTSVVTAQTYENPSEQDYVPKKAEILKL